jgi:MobA/MobL family
MALYHLSVKPVSRKAGRSATAAIAYRTADRIRDLTTDEVFDYTRKRGVEHTEIVLPREAARQDINWARDRQALWNAAEMAENRSNSRVAREYEIALPHELNKAQRVELVRAFSKDLADRYGVGVDFAIHAPHRSGDERNHHAHILTTTRRIEAGGLGEKSEIEWSDGNRRKAGLGPAKEEIGLIRARWETLHNEHLLSHGIEVRIDHRSLEAQGIDREPTTHLGPAVSAMERRGMETEVGRRIEWQMREAAQLRLEQAAELWRLERERQELSGQVLVLDSDLQTAKKERDQGLHIAADESGAVVKKRGLFDGLKLGSESRAGEQDPFAHVRLEGPKQSPALAHDPALVLDRAVDRYARAWLDALQMRVNDLPILEHQKIELRNAGAGLEKMRPGAVSDLNIAIEFEPAMHRAMTQLEGPRRSAELLAGLQHEARVRADPNLQAERLVKTWKVLEEQREKLQGWEHKEAREEVIGRVRNLALTLKRSPKLEEVVRRRAHEFGIEPGSRLALVLHERDIKRALRLSERELGRSHGLSL